MTHGRSLIALGALLITTPIAAQQGARTGANFPLAGAQSVHAPPANSLEALFRAKLLAPLAWVGVTPKSTAIVRADSLQRRRRTCPMPVVEPDSLRFGKRPAAPRDSTPMDRMPILPPGCDNPLRR